METVGPPPADAELNLLTQWGDPASGTRTRKAAVLSVAFHAMVLIALTLVPPDYWYTPPRREEPVIVRRVTPLVEPLTEFTQKRPNEGKLTKQIDVASLQPRERIQTPKSTPSTTRPAATRPAPVPAPVTRQPAA